MIEEVTEDATSPVAVAPKSGWADSMLKIARPTKKNLGSSVLSDYLEAKRVKKEDVDEEESSEGSSDEDSKPPTSSYARKMERFRIGRQKPNVLDAPKERMFSKIATRGVVQLFNAVKKHQGPVSSTNKEVFNSVDKKSFLDILSGNKIKDEDDT